MVRREAALINLWWVAADLVVLLHLGFVVFAVLGGLLVLKWRRIIWLHLPAVGWAALIEFRSWICPLTPLENWLRQQGGGQGYETGFIENYLLPLLYPAELTPDLQIFLGLVVLGCNGLVYGWLLFRWKRRSRRA
jgi:hypothetical protein